MTYREFIERLEADGWQFLRNGKGGHLLYCKPGRLGFVVVAGGGKLNRDEHTGTLNAIFREAGLK
jgi:predicted RNA binding protein YcfA (HicA-like mRNA interferase family)